MSGERRRLGPLRLDDAPQRQAELPAGSRSQPAATPTQIAAENKPKVSEQPTGRPVSLGKRNVALVVGVAAGIAVALAAVLVVIAAAAFFGAKAVRADRIVETAPTPPAWTPPSSSPTPECACGYGRRCDQGACTDVLLPDSEWFLKVTGAVVTTSPSMNYSKPSSFSVPIGTNDKICVTVNRTRDRCCKVGSKGECRVRVRISDLIRSGAGLKVELFDETGTPTATIARVAFAYPAVRFAANGYSFPVDPPAAMGARASVTKLLAWLEEP